MIPILIPDLFDPKPDYFLTLTCGNVAMMEISRPLVVAGKSAGFSMGVGVAFVCRLPGIRPILEVALFSPN